MCQRQIHLEVRSTLSSSQQQQVLVLGVGIGQTVSPVLAGVCNICQFKFQLQKSQRLILNGCGMWTTSLVDLMYLTTITCDCNIFFWVANNSVLIKRNSLMNTIVSVVRRSTQYPLCCILYLQFVVYRVSRDPEPSISISHLTSLSVLFFYVLALKLAEAYRRNP